MQLPNRKLLGKFGEVLKGKNAEAKLTAVLIAIGLLAVPFVLLLANEASAEVVFTEDFEDINDWTFSGSGSVTQDNTTVHGGNYSVHVVDTVGSDQPYIYNENISVLDSSFTVEFYVYVGTLQACNFIKIATTTTSSTDRWNVGINDTGNVIVRWKDENTDQTDVVSANTTLVTGQWYKFTIVGDNTTLSVYVDGSKALDLTFTSGDTLGSIAVGDQSTTFLDDYYVDDLTVSNTSDYPAATPTIDISISISPDSDGDGRISFGSTNQTNVSMDSVDFIIVTENGNVTVANLTITMQNIGGAIPTYYGGATNCYVYKWNGTTAPTSVNLSDSNWVQVASFNSSYQATITGLSLGQGQSIYLAFRILDNDPENDGIAAGTYESTTTAHSITAS